LILGRPEAEGDATDVFDDPVEALTAGVGQDRRVRLMAMVWPIPLGCG
jgi:hypothetical protein